MWSNCICGKSREFVPIITYRGETVFKEYEGLEITRCVNCAVLKTIAAKGRLKPETSRVEFYEGNLPIFRGYFTTVAERIARYRKVGRVLDIGCASGILLEILAQRGFDVYGLEPNKKAFKIAKKKLAQRIYPIKLRKFLVQRKQLFDILIYNHVLEHIEDINREFSLIKKALRPHGLLVIGLPNTDNIIFKLRGKYWESLLPDQHVWHFSTAYVRSLLRKEGFEILMTTFNNHLRQDYPYLKRLYFEFLTRLNTLSGTGEAMLVIARRIDKMS